MSHRSRPSYEFLKLFLKGMLFLTRFLKVQNSCSNTRFIPAPVRFNSNLSTFLKFLISFKNIKAFSKIVRSCAAQKRMKMTFEKKIQ